MPGIYELRIATLPTSTAVFAIEVLAHLQCTALGTFASNAVVLWHTFWGLLGGGTISKNAGSSAAHIAAVQHSFEPPG